MSAERLFDPADYGVTVPAEKKRQTPPEIVTVKVGGATWVVLQRLRSAPLAHLNKIDFKVPRAANVLLAECGAMGFPMREFDFGTSMPACSRCAAIARKRGLL